MSAPIPGFGPGRNDAPDGVSICVCTFRRAHLSRTLASLLADCAGAGDVSVEIVVADNDERPSARDAVRAMEQRARDGGVALRYVHCPAGNISLARNAALDAAAHSRIAFVDDDERVRPGWLGALRAAMARTGAAVVLGPVDAVYGAHVPVWMRDADLHSTRPVWKNGAIRTGYTCNVLFDVRHPTLRGRRFDLARGRTGGEDTAFFDAAWREGATIAFAPDARVEEDVTPERATVRWIARRRFRSGQTHASLPAAGNLLTRGGAARGAALFVAGSKVAACGMLALVNLARRERAMASLLRGALHAGTVAGLLGMNQARLYGAPAPSRRSDG